MHVLNYYIQTDLQLQALFADFPRFTGRNSCAFFTCISAVFVSRVCA